MHEENSSWGSTKWKKVFDKQQGISEPFNSIHSKHHVPLGRVTSACICDFLEQGLCLELVCEVLQSYGIVSSAEYTLWRSAVLHSVNVYSARHLGNR